MAREESFADRLMLWAEGLQGHTEEGCVCVCGINGYVSSYGSGVNWEGSPVISAPGSYLSFFFDHVLCIDISIRLSTSLVLGRCDQVLFA